MDVPTMVAIQPGNVSQSAGLTRIGESLLFRLGITYDKGRDNVESDLRSNLGFGQDRNWVGWVDS